jgi:thioredoxin-related protein
LKLISGFPPPMTYSESPYGVGNSKGGGNTSAQILPDGAHLGAHDLIAFEDYDKGVAYAKSVNKPILLDFTGFACVNCRKMEDYVWSKPEILSILKNDVVLISLFVDDKRELPASEQYVSKETGKEIKTIGNKWSDFQITNYKANAQPYYIILDNNENRLNEPVGYTPDSNEYKTWLENGISKFKK